MNKVKKSRWRSKVWARSRPTSNPSILVKFITFPSYVCKESSSSIIWFIVHPLSLRACSAPTHASRVFCTRIVSLFVGGAI